MKTTTMAGFLALAAALGACGRAHDDFRTAGGDAAPNLLDDPDHVRFPEGQDGLNFIVIGGNYAGLVKYAKNETIRVCLSGDLSPQAAEAWKAKITDVTMKWLAPLRGLTSAPLASGVAFVTSQCHGRVLVRVQNNAYTEVVDPPRVVVAPSGYYGSYNVLLHEFGHAFGLGDTYMNGTSGNCRPGQPQAVMCNTSFSELQPDDVAGMKRVFKAVFPQDAP